MKLSLTDSATQNIESPCIVIGVIEGGALSPSAAALDKASGGSISQMLENRDIAVSHGKTTFLHRVEGISAERVLVVGFGKLKKLNRSRFDGACLAAGKALRNHPLTACHICLHEVEFGEAGFSWKLRQAALAIYRANYRYTATKPLKKIIILSCLPYILYILDASI